MKKILFLLLALLTLTATAQQMPKLPADPAFRIGKLDNGMTYYIRHNEHPEHVANFYIAQRVGSIQEEDTQRGLAHFLEHMAFNGSTHFEGDGIIEFTRSLGVAFGRDLNAYTSIEQTVYNINNVPVARTSALDSCLLVLLDWAGGLQLLTEEIDKERGVIHGEWAMRNSAAQRLFERNLPQLYPGNKYGERMPIGTMEVVDNFKPEELRAYYRKWYHPENQALIVVGDIDVDHIEAKIKELFSANQAGPEAAHVVPLEVADNAEAIYVVDHDKELQFSTLEVLMKSEPLPAELRGTAMEYAQYFMSHMIASMFNERIAELSLQPDCPFVQMRMSYGNYLLSSTKDAFDIDAVAKEGHERETLETLVREVRRVKEFGFTGSEFFRAKEEFMSRREKEYTNRDKHQHETYYRAALANYLHGDALPTAEVEYQLWQMLSQQFPVEKINQVAAAGLTIDNDTNFVCIEFAREHEGATYHTVADLQQIVAAARAEQLTAWVDNTKDEPLLPTLPKAGKIKKETRNEALGYTELLLSNGAKVVLKKTDFKDDEVLLSGFAPGGKSQYDEADYCNLKVFDYVTSTFGLGNFSNNEIDKALAGKQCGVSIDLGNRYNTLSGFSTPKDLETMFQLLYLRFTAPKHDELAYNTLMGQLQAMLANRNLRPETQFNDSITALLYGHNARFSSMTVEDLPNIDAERIMAMARENFSKVGNFTFTLVGNFDEEQARQFVCQYIASLPGKGKTPTTRDIRTYFTGELNCEFTRQMETPKPNIAEFWKSKSDFSLRNSILNRYVGNILRMILLKSVREDAGAAYSVGASCMASYAKEQTYTVMSVQAPISDPTKVDTALVLIQQGVAELAAEADADMVAKVMANLVKQHNVDSRENSHWQDVIEDYLMRGIDMQTDYLRIVESITPDMVSQYLRDVVLKDGDHLTVVMRPEE